MKHLFPISSENWGEDSFGDNKIIYKETTDRYTRTCMGHVFLLFRDSYTRCYIVAQKFYNVSCKLGQTYFIYFVSPLIPYQWSRAFLFGPLSINYR